MKVQVRLLELMTAYWNEMEHFHIGSTFDHRGSYSERKGAQLQEIRNRYRPGIEHCQLLLTLGIEELPEEASAVEAVQRGEQP